MRLVICTFAFLAFAFYEMSGGSDFDPVETRLARVDAPAADVPATRVAEAETVAEEVVTQVAYTAPIKLDLKPVEVAEEPVSDAPERADEDVVLASLDPETPQIILPSLIQPSNARQATPLQQAETPAVDDGDVRSVTGSRVNVRGGPGTNFAVVNTLIQGDQVEVLRDPGAGWVMLRPMNGGPVGWMADFLLSEG